MLSVQYHRHDIHACCSERALLKPWFNILTSLFDFEQCTFTVFVEVVHLANPCTAVH